MNFENLKINPKILSYIIKCVVEKHNWEFNIFVLDSLLYRKCKETTLKEKYGKLDMTADFRRLEHTQKCFNLKFFI